MPSAVPPHFKQRYCLLSSPDHHQGSALTGVPVPFYSGLDLSGLDLFFGPNSGRHSAEATEGGFQPLTSPSLAAYQLLTPPGSFEEC
jgi:hypothetical protein